MPDWKIFFTYGGKKYSLSFLETCSPLGQFLFFPLVKQIRVQVVSCFPLNSAVRKIKVKGWCWNPATWLKCCYDNREWWEHSGVAAVYLPKSTIAIWIQKRVGIPTGPISKESREAGNLYLYIEGTFTKIGL